MFVCLFFFLNAIGVDDEIINSISSKNENLNQIAVIWCDNQKINSIDDNDHVDNVKEIIKSKLDTNNQYRIEVHTFSFFIFNHIFS